MHFDMTVRWKTPYKPPWYRQLIFSGLIIFGGAYAWRRFDQDSFERNVALFVEFSAAACSAVFKFFEGGDDLLQMRVVTLL